MTDGPTYAAEGEEWLELTPLGAPPASADPDAGAGPPGRPATVSP